MIFRLLPISFLALFFISCGLPDETYILADPVVLPPPGAPNDPSGTWNVSGSNNITVTDYGVNVYYKIYLSENERNQYNTDIENWKKRINESIQQVYSNLGFYPVKLYENNSFINDKIPQLSLDLINAWSLDFNANILSSSTNDIFFILLSDKKYTFSRQTNSISEINQFYNFQHTDTDISASIKEALRNSTTKSENLYVGLVLILVGTTVDSSYLVSNPYQLGFHKVIQ